MTRLVMRNMALILVTTCMVAGCEAKTDAPLLGTLEWDRVSVAAEASEPILKITVKEGDFVHAGDPVLELDSRRTQADVARVQALMQQAQAQLAELRHGARVETINAARAELARAAAEAENANSERLRYSDLLASGAVSKSVYLRVETIARSADETQRAARAKLAELLRGTRPEQVDQAEAALAALKAEAQSLQIRRDRLSVRAPRDGRIDALPFKLGDQPPQGATLVTLLAGPAPYARVYVPASRRAQLTVGMPCRVRVTGVDETFDAILHSLRSDPAFTPYYALTGEDSSRLAYRAELTLDGVAATKLPAGLPVTADCPASGG